MATLVHVNEKAEKKTQKRVRELTSGHWFTIKGMSPIYCRADTTEPACFVVGQQDGKQWGEGAVREGWGDYLVEHDFGKQQFRIDP